MVRILLALVLLPALAFAQPSVTSVTGTVAHGGTITITGTGFGTKPTTSPVHDVDFEDGYGTLVPRYSAEDISIENISRNPFSAKASYADMNGSNQLSFLGDSGTSWKFYLSYWVWAGSNIEWGCQINGDLNLGNVKFFRMNRGAGQEYLISSGGSNSPGCQWYLNRVSQSGMNNGTKWWHDPDLHGHPSSFPTDQWNLVEVEIIESTGLGVADGSYRYWLNGEEMIFLENIVTRNNATVPASMLFLGIENKRWEESGDSTPDDYYIDDLYLDQTPARVMLANASSFGSTTVREIQEILSWSDTSITVKVRQGNYADDETAYVYVADDDGEISNGAPVTIGTAGPAPLTMNGDFAAINASADVEYYNSGFVYGIRNATEEIIFGYEGAAPDLESETWDAAALTVFGGWSTMLGALDDSDYTAPPYWTAEYDLKFAVYRLR